MMGIVDGENMDNKELISVIMPAYNSEKYIGRTIESVLAQDYANLELIIVDDGSKDNTRAIAEGYAARDSRIKVLVQSNQGVSVARNYALDNAIGKYVAFLDSDDLWDSDNLTNMVNVGEHTDAGFICAGMDIVNIDGSIEQGDTIFKDGSLMEFVTDNNEIRFFFGVGSILIRRDILERYHIRFDAGIAIMEDIGFYIKLLTVTKIKHVPKIMAHYCKHDASATTAAYNPEKWSGSVEIFKYAEPYISKYRPEWQDKFIAIRNYYVYRFVWTVVKNGMYDAALHYIDKYKQYLQDFLNTGHKCNDRLKCRCLLMKSKAVMKLLTGFREEAEGYYGA